MKRLSKALGDPGGRSFSAYGSSRPWLGRSFRRMVATYPVTVYARRPYVSVLVRGTVGPVSGTYRQRSNTVRLYYI